VLAAFIIALMMEAGSTYETSVDFYQTTWRNTPEDECLWLFLLLWFTASPFSLNFLHFKVRCNNICFKIIPLQYSLLKFLKNISVVVYTYRINATLLFANIWRRRKGLANIGKVFFPSSYKNIITEIFKSDNAICLITWSWGSDIDPQRLVNTLQRIIKFFSSSPW
jgi:hypothetical protein